MARPHLVTEHQPALGVNLLRNARGWRPSLIGEGHGQFVVAAVAVVVRVAYWVAVTPKWVPEADADQYVLLARSLAGGHGFRLQFPQLAQHATAFRPPLYPLLLTPSTRVFGAALWPDRLINVVLGAVVAVLVCRLATRVAGGVSMAGVVAGLAAAAHPALVANDTVTLTEPLSLALLVGAVLLVDDDRWAAAAAVTGLMALARPNAYLVAAILAVWVGHRLGVRRAGTFLGVAALVVAPWLLRNHFQVGTWKLTTSDGFTIAAVWAPPSQAAGRFIDPVFSPAYGDDDHRLAQFDEAGWDAKLGREGLDGMRNHPGYLAHIIPRNALGYFELRTRYNRYPEGNDGRNWAFRQASLPAFFVITAVGMFGVARFRRDRRVLVLGVIVAQYVVLSLLLVAPPRLRAPFDLFMCLGVGLAAAALRPRSSPSASTTS